MTNIEIHQDRDHSMVREDCRLGKDEVSQSGRANPIIPCLALNNVLTRHTLLYRVFNSSRLKDEGYAVHNLGA